MSRGNIYDDYDTAGPKHAPHPVQSYKKPKRAPRSIQRSDAKCGGVSSFGTLLVASCPANRNSLLGVQHGNLILALCEECLPKYMKPGPDPTAVVSIHGEPVHDMEELEDLLYPEYCPECNTPLVLKKGRYGLFMACPTWPKCSGAGCAEPDLKQVTRIQGNTDRIFVHCGDWSKTFLRKEFFGGLDEKGVLEKVSSLPTFGYQYHEMKLTKTIVEELKKYALRTDGPGCWMVRIQNADHGFSTPQDTPVEKEEQMPRISPAYLIKKPCDTGAGICFTEQNKDLPVPNKWYLRGDKFGRTAVLLASDNLWNCWNESILVQQNTSEQQARNWVFYGTIDPDAIAPITVNKPLAVPVTKQEPPMGLKEQLDRARHTPSVLLPSANLGPVTVPAKGKKKTMKKTLDVMKQSAVVGAKTAAADEAGNVVLDVAKKLLGDKLPGLFVTEEGRSLAKFFIASGLHAGADVVAPDSDKSAALQTACVLVMEAASRDVIQPNLALLRPMILDLVKIGQGKVIA